jgi:hypothetical protein
LIDNPAAKKTTGKPKRRQENTLEKDVASKLEVYEFRLAQDAGK